MQWRRILSKVQSVRFLIKAPIRDMKMEKLSLEFIDLMAVRIQNFEFL